MNKKNLIFGYKRIHEPKFKKIQLKTQFGQMMQIMMKY